MKKLLDYNPISRVAHVWHWDEATEETVITSEQNLDDLFSVNNLLANEQGKRFNRGEEGTLVAKVPMSLFSEWSRTGKLLDQKYLFRWLNDIDNRRFRTHGAVL